MKKILIISILIFTILIGFIGTSYAAFNVTEESLQKAVDKYMANLEKESADASIKLDKTNKQVLLTSEGESYTINYDLSSKPKFNIDLSFNSSMTKEECELEIERSSLLMIMFVLVADSAEIEFEDSMMYVLSSLMGNSTSTKNITYTTPIEYVKALYDDRNNSTLIDDLFTWTHTKISETPDEYKVKSTIVINNDKDFSIINGTSDEIVDELSNSIISSAQNIANNYKNSLEKDEIITRPNVNVNKFNNSTSKLPQTGNFFDTTDGLALISTIAFIILIFIIIKNIKYKNIKQK